MTYQVSEDGITINVSDEISVFPDKITPTPDDEGVIAYYELLNLKDSKNIFWREKLGEGLKRSFEDVTFPKAILTDFPKGYKLYVHRKKYPKNPKKEERMDFYLFGRHKFRSPNEFSPHLIWLISDRSGQCLCKYCMKSTATSGRRTPVPSVTKAKRQRGVDTSDEAPVPKRITRSNAGKATDNRKRVVKNRRITTDNRKKNVRSSTKKRKSKVVEKNLPPPVPKYAVYREGEIVWLVINEILNDKILAECNNFFSIDSQLEYWPAIVGTITPQDDNESYESTIYTVKPLILNGNKNVTIDSLRPWLIHSSDKSLNGNNRFTRSLLNIDLDEATSEQIVGIYFKAIQKANEIAKVFTPIYQYDYHKTRRTKKKHDDAHGAYYKAIYFGTELIYEDDLVRLIPEEPEDKNGSVQSNNQHKETKGTYLQITSIFEDFRKGFQITGDLYERGKLLEKNEYEWIPKNKQDEEYTIGVEDIAGRLYPMYSGITEFFVCELLKTLDNRKLMLGEDVPPIVTTPPNTVNPRESGTSNRHKTVATPIIKKQAVKRSSPLPPILTGESTILPQNLPSKRARKHLEVEIKERRETDVETKMEGKEATKSIEKARSPVKFLDIERKYTKKSDDTVVSPDTPTFETDDDISDGDTSNKINKINANDSDDDNGENMI